MRFVRSTALATWVGSLAGKAGVIIAYKAISHSQGQLGQQSFSVVINGAGGSSDNGSSEKRMRSASLDFDVKKCDVSAKLVSCSLTVVSPRYDRRFGVQNFYTTLIDADGDTFRMTSDGIGVTLERDQKFPFKLAFEVNKDVVRPLTVRMRGSIDSQQLDKGFEIK